MVFFGGGSLVAFGVCALLGCSNLFAKSTDSLMTCINVMELFPATMVGIHREHVWQVVLHLCERVSTLTLRGQRFIERKYTRRPPA